MKAMTRQRRRLCCIALASLAASLLVTLGLVLPGWADTIDENTPVPPVGTEGGPSIELTPDQPEQWKRGRIVFDRDVNLSEGLGTPELNADSCRSCHLDPVIGGAGGLDVNVFRFGLDNGGGPFEDLPGGQAGSKLRRVDVPGRENTHPDADVFEQRQTPTTFGLGAVDTILESAILANQDPNDMDGDGIMGMARMIDVNGTLEVGRFGWKCQLPQLQDFIRDAMGGELGQTVPDNGRPFGIFVDDDPQPDPELSEEDFDDIAFFLGFLSAPPRGGSTDPAVAQGEQVFADIGCAICHIPSLEGSEGPVPLYSDLLIHHVLPADFRGMGEDGADVGFYRTPPLWGISRAAPYFHDGRAETLLDAILTHDGEASGVIESYEDLSDSDKTALIKFLEDL